MVRPTGLAIPLPVIQWVSYLRTYSGEAKDVTRKDLPGLPATIPVATQVAARLGRGALLFRTLPAQPGHYR